MMIYDPTEKCLGYCDGNSWKCLDSTPLSPSGSETSAAFSDGAVILGTTGPACSGTYEGGIRYNTSAKCVELCDGTSWGCVTAAANKRAFITSGDYEARTLGGLSGADSTCNTAASAAGLGGTWKAWLSDSSTDARDRIADQAYYRVDGTKIADSMADLTDGSLDAALNVTESGSTRDNRVMTNTDSDGTKGGRNCCDFDDSGCSAYQHTAESQNTNNYWTDNLHNEWCHDTYPIYCFEQ
jgi:hypothetical protein